ncbi:MAG: hypothetical protein RL701_7136 [Pseudomonadota bacterium]|jgi:chemotaxis response regulator CheB
MTEPRGRVLVVDDEVDALSALELLKSFDPDVVLRLGHYR